MNIENMEEIEKNYFYIFAYKISQENILDLGKVNI